MDTGAALLLLFHAASSLAMTGLIWFVQVVHYPLFPYAAAGDFPAFASEHQWRTGWVVGPLMLLEAATATLLLVSPMGPAALRLAWFAWALLVSIWLSTAFVQVPLHRRLASRFDPQTVRRLVLTNWWRTVAWTARSFVAVLLLRL